MKHLNQQKKRAGYNYKVMLIAFVIAVLATVLLLCSFNPTEVYALTNTGSAYQAGGGQELWDASAGAFNDVHFLRPNAKFNYISLWSDFILFLF